MRPFRTLAAPVLLLAALLSLTSGTQPPRLKPVGAGAVTAWSIDFLVEYHAGPNDSAAPARWATDGTVTDWELDVDSDSVALNWVLGSGNLGAYTYVAGVGDGKPHRVHLDARQAGPDIVVALTVSGVTVKPITLEGQRIGAVKVLYESPAQTIRQATFTATVGNATAWNVF